jgi:hypothetical protein
MMKLQVRIVKSAKDWRLTLCDEHGEPLPNQVKVELYNSVTDKVKVSVTFDVDENFVKLVGDVVPENAKGTD